MSSGSEEKVLKKLLLLLILYMFKLELLVQSRHVTCAADKYTDGCSVPLAFPAPFKNEFTAACDRHDICYGCGHHYEWSRSNCDDAFYKNMKLICENLREKRSLLDSLLDLWNAISTVGSSKTHCDAAAKMYYEGVHLFAASHYDNFDHDYCLSTCAFQHGNPKFNITFL